MDIGRDAHRVKSLSRHTLEQLVMHSSEGILLADAKDSKLRVVYANPAYEDLSGYSLAELTGKGWPLAQRDGAPEVDRLRAAIGRAEPCHVVVGDLRKDGTTWLSDVSIEPLHNARGELKYFLCIQKPAPAGVDRASSSTVPVVAESDGDPEDAPASVAVASAPSRPEPPVATVVDAAAAGARAKLTNVNRIDQATGLLRPEHFLDLVRRDAAVARRDRCSLSFAVIEIVEFDSYRQTFGVKAGDSCQRMIGVQLTRALRRAGDLCARYDGSALVAAVLGQEPEQLRRLMNQVVENVRQLGLHNPRAKSGRYIWIRYTVAGIAPGGDDGEPAEIIARTRAELGATPVPVTAPAHVTPTWAAQPEPPAPKERLRGKTSLAAVP